MDWTLILFLGLVGSGCNVDLPAEDGCEINQFLDPASINEVNISSPGYPDKMYDPGENRVWCISAPPHINLTITCETFHIPKSVDCEMDGLIISSTKNAPRAYCGSKQLQIESHASDVKIQFYSNQKSKGGKFFCQVKPQEQTEVSLRRVVNGNCDCGYSFSPRIVGGVEAGINEFPFMAGLVDSRRGAFVVCGATIISARYVLTAGHCFDMLDITFTAVLIGDHNIDTGLETPATILIRAKRFINYSFNNNIRRNDIAMVELVSPVAYGSRVGPVCLPFRSRYWDLTGQQVTLLGWGTIEYGGQLSLFLRKAYANLVDINYCTNSYGGDVDGYSQLCTYKTNSDACQFDSGGPLIWINSEIGRYEIVGIVSYGRACGAQDPSVNTKVGPFLQWILDNTPGEDFCFK